MRASPHVSVSAGVNSVRFENDNAAIGSMVSLDAELVDLKRKVPVSPDVELWLGESSFRSYTVNSIDLHSEYTLQPQTN